MPYYMTSRSNSTTREWERCNAKTKTGAKREAYNRFRGGYLDETISLAWRADDDPIPGHQQIAVRSQYPDARWIDLL